MTIRPLIKQLVAIVAVGLLAIILVSNFIKSRMTASVNTCIDRNLPAIAAAKVRWAEANGKAAGATPTPTDLLPYLEGGRWPVCPLGGTYTPGSVGANPRCSFTNEHPWRAPAVERR